MYDIQKHVYLYTILLYDLYVYLYYLVISKRVPFRECMNNILYSTAVAATAIAVISTHNILL